MVNILCSNVTIYAYDEELVIAQSVLGENGLNIMDTNADTKYMTRAEMAEVLLNFTQICNDDVFLQLNDIKYPPSYDFYPDELYGIWPISDWEVPNEMVTQIQRLCRFGIIQGNGEDKFYPDNFCTYNEAITFIVRSLGWTNLAHMIDDNEYPEGYIQVAQNLFLISQEIEGEETQIRDDIIKLVFRGLFVDTNKYDGIIQEEKGAIPSYVSDMCPIKKYHGLQYTFGYAEKKDAEITINDSMYFGDVINNSKFENGYVLCIYNTPNEEENNIIICVELSEQYYNEFVELRAHQLAE